MPRIFLGNFEFEHELAGRAMCVSSMGSESPGRAREAPGESIASQHFWAWLPISQADDYLIAPCPIAAQDLAPLADLGLAVPGLVCATDELGALTGAELVPWGWTPSVVAFGKQNGWQCPTPPADVVRKVNSREFRFALEQARQIGLAGSALVTSLAELARVLQEHGNMPLGWLLKANFGMSGRETVRGRGATLDEKTQNWARKRLATAGPIVFEPIVECIAEAGIQIDVPRFGPPELVGITPLLVDGSGVYRGSRFASRASDTEDWRPAEEVALQAARELQRLGYFGPLGIDAMQYRDENDQIRLRPLQDINARYTMGRLALGFRRILPAGWCGTWVHFSRRRLQGRDVSQWIEKIDILSKGARVVAASPHTIGLQIASHQAVLVLAPTPEVRNQTEALLFSLNDL